RYLSDYLRGVLLHRFFLQDAQDVERRRFGAADMADAMAARARYVRRLGKRGTQPLAGKLHQPEAGDLAELHPRSVVFERVLEPVLDLALVLAAFHVDKVDHDQAAQVAQPQLPGDLFGSLEVRI